MRSRRIVVILLLVASLIGALVTGRDLFYNLLYLWLALVVIAGVWTWTSLQDVRVGRQTRTLRAQVGDKLEERLAVRNLSRLPKLWLEVRDQSELPGHRPSKVLVSVGPKEDRIWVSRTLCRQRGRYRLGPLTVTSGDPFGLFQTTRAIAQTNHVVIYPMTVDLPEFILPLGTAPGGDALRRRTHYVTPNASGVRDYAPGDSLNRIHWRSTARRDRLMVKEFELDPLADVWLLLDGDRTMQAGEFVLRIPEEDMRWYVRAETVALPPSSEEYSVSVTATLAQHFVRRDRAVGLVSYGETREVVQPERGERQLTKLLERLAVFHAVSTVSLYSALMLEADQLPRGTTLIVVTASWDMRWANTLRSLKRRGVSCVAVLVNAASFGGKHDNSGLAEALWGIGIPAYRVNNGDDLTAALTMRG
jgi:uncharacterized protein (DUF58 family)